MWEIILNIGLSILSIGLAGLTYYFDVKSKITEQLNAEISKAEDTEYKDIEKRAFVVSELKKIVPKALRFIFTDKVLEKLVQKAFDGIEDYAQKQVAKKSK